MKFKYTRELKFGLIVIGAIFLLYFGLNFLKGINIFHASNSFYAKFEKIDGLVVSSQVQIKGFRVGQVDAIEFDFTQEKPFTVRFSVLSEIQVPKGTIVEMFDDGLLGGRALQLLIPTGNIAQSSHQSGDEIPSQINAGLFGQISDVLIPKVEGFMLQADSVMRSLRSLLENENLANTLETADQLASDLTATNRQINRLLTNQIPLLLNNANTLMTDFSAVSEHLQSFDIAKANQTMATLDNTISTFGNTAENLNELSFGLMRVSSSADSLLIDLRKNPSRYVHFSLFGRRQ